MISTATRSPEKIYLWRVALAIVLALLQLPAQAQNYPTRPIRLISPFPAGGANDVLARVLAGKLAERLRGSVVVENRPGAGAVIGLTVLARSAPDGYTLALSGSTLAVAGTLYKQPPFDAMKDFAPVALVTHYPFVLVVNPSLPAHSVPELIQLAKEQPGKLLYASPGAASPQHLYTELFKGMAGIELGHIPYSGTAPAVAARGGARNAADRGRHSRLQRAQLDDRACTRRNAEGDRAHATRRAQSHHGNARRAGADRANRHVSCRQPGARRACILHQRRGHALGQDRATGWNRRDAVTSRQHPHSHILCAGTLLALVGSWWTVTTCKF
jgi:hypothetical protein